MENSLRPRKLLRRSDRYKRLSVWMAPYLFEEFEALCRARGINKSELVRLAIKRILRAEHKSERPPRQ